MMSGTATAISFRLSGLQARICIGDMHVEHTCALNNIFALLRGDSVGDLGSIGAVVHQEQVDILRAMDDELVKTAGKHVARALVRAVTNVGHGPSALEAPSCAAVDAPRVAPAWLQMSVRSEEHELDLHLGNEKRRSAEGQDANLDAFLMLRLRAHEGLRALLDPVGFQERLHHLCFSSLARLRLPSLRRRQHPTHQLYLRYC